MGPNPNGPLSKLRLSYLIPFGVGVRSVGPVGDFLKVGDIGFGDGHMNHMQNNVALRIQARPKRITPIESYSGIGLQPSILF